jgi:hypothetical protein
MKMLRAMKNQPKIAFPELRGQTDAPILTTENGSLITERGSR